MTDLILLTYGVHQILSQAKVMYSGFDQVLASVGYDIKIWLKYFCFAIADTFIVSFSIGYTFAKTNQNIPIKP